MKKRAIVSVHDKSGLVNFARQLMAQGWEIVASGGTARELIEAGLAVVEVSAITHFPEMLGGRVKTLHPAVHAGILARESAEDLAELARQDIVPIDLVVCNLYPFARTAADPDVTSAAAIEQIDIGGVTLLRAAAKNFERVLAVCEPSDYGSVLSALASGTVDRDKRRAFAAKVFALTRDYDSAIESYLRGKADEVILPEQVTLSLTRTQSLRYGENPHQQAALYSISENTGPLGGRLLQGKELSYNNLLDLDAAWRAASSFDSPAVVVVKHLSPCGLATADSVAAALSPAIASDPLSAFGGVLAVNRPVGEDFTAALEQEELFVEAVAAPNFSEAAVAWFAAHKKNCRLLTLSNDSDSAIGDIEWRSVRGGMVAQASDVGDPDEATEWQTASTRPPTTAEARALRFAWTAVQHVRSNAIVLATEHETVGIGGGLPSRVDAVRLAVEKAGPRVAGTVLASDAFFPFADGIELAAAAGVTAVIQPGGSIRDADVIAAADRLGLAMVLTGVRHFRH